ncbi:MAG: exodeoxyribonuclease V subunit beta [Oceanospirillaceae bacterium]|nr:exodeoxyribonuclease V subunit beta [Oceanospirillaceae bacterium]MBT13799.1 exodeoxyribonuclease V subunit beta [Oceanospirillaceae bacterium]|tara:strand:- start:9756 stop:13736 length:3981 start_codon:yes stop_codon:yes gene_type:complete
MKTLSIPDFPLRGQSLIEASAGTGKTFTITGLYNRLILGHGLSASAGTDARLGCDQILVVTFTRAATEELRGRIRQRLRSTLEDLLRLDNGQPAEDTHLNQYLQEIADKEKRSETDIRQQLLPWLQTNLALMDEAAIYTIHGFCQRMLRQFAFDSGVVFDAELVLDSERYLQQACEDVWRTQAYGLNEGQGRFLLSKYSGPDALFNKVRARISRPDMMILPVLESQDLQALWQQAEHEFQQLAALCADTSEADLAALIQDSGLDKRSYSKKNAPNWIAQMMAYFSAEFYLPPPDNLSRLTPSGMATKLKDGALPQHPLFDQLERFLASADALTLMLEAAWLDVIKTRYFELLEKAGALTPDDLLRLLSTALRGHQGEKLAAHIRRQYPQAMIDEFQDTDPQQYDIFNRIYPPCGLNAPQDARDTSQLVPSDDYGLIMIGDPKQAIYGFRGADIFTYIKARRQLSDEQRFTLATNWRSHSQLVDGVNQLFSAHSSPFVYDSDIAFVTVQAAGKADSEAFSVGAEPQAPLQLWFDGEEYSRSQAQGAVARQCAERINALIQGAGQLGNNAVQAKDIAVLVRSRKQAGWIREALMACGIGSVFLTRDSVYDSQEAADLFCWLQAVAHPADERALRTALATRTQGYSAVQLDELLNNEQAWENVLEQNFIYHRLWNRRGVMAAVMQWLEEDGRAERLRRHNDGERRLTNIMHLGELLQAASRRLRGHEALLRWFGEQVFSEERSGDEAQLRLESDANLVTIVTIHKSKGLEYPLVFLPYLWDDSFQPDARSDTQYFSGQHDAMVLDLAPDNEARAAAQQDALAESLRLLYVALTRAVQGCFIWLTDAVNGQNKKQKKSRIAETALGYLLQLDPDPDWAALQQRINQSGALQMLAPPLWQTEQTRHQSINDTPQIRAAQLAHSHWDHWRVSSYSQLTAAHGGENYEDSAYEEGVLRTDEPERPQDILVADSELYYLTGQTAGTPDEDFNADHPALTFVRGANAGTCLHAILEHWDFHAPDLLADITTAELKHYGLLAVSADDADRGAGEQAEGEPLLPSGAQQTEQPSEERPEQVTDLCQWLTSVVQSPLMNDQGDVFTLQDIAAEERLDEMEFYLPVAGLRAEQINTLLALPADNSTTQSGRFQFDPLSGYLKGFIDLIFCYRGRYYVADYKSNHLGYRLQDYSPQALQQAMQDHQYDLQAWIYTVALDQLLRQRLPDYSPQQHLGGVYYFYLRGMHLGASAPLFACDASVLSASGFAESSDLPDAADVLDSADDNRQGDLFAQAAETESQPPAGAVIRQPPGVYYHGVDEQALQLWRRVLGAAQEEDVV